MLIDIILSWLEKKLPRNLSSLVDLRWFYLFGWLIKKLVELFNLPMWLEGSTWSFACFYILTLEVMSLNSSRRLWRKFVWKCLLLSCFAALLIWPDKVTYFIDLMWFFWVAVTLGFCPLFCPSLVIFNFFFVNHWHVWLSQFVFYHD